MHFSSNASDSTALRWPGGAVPQQGEAPQAQQIAQCVGLRDRQMIHVEVEADRAIGRTGRDACC